MKNYKDFGAAIWINTDEITGKVFIDFEFAMHLQVGDTFRFYDDEGTLAPWINIMDCEGNWESINTSEFILRKRFFDADSLTLFADEIQEE